MRAARGDRLMIRGPKYPNHSGGYLETRSWQAPQILQQMLQNLIHCDRSIVYSEWSAVPKRRKPNKARNRLLLGKKISIPARCCSSTGTPEREQQLRETRETFASLYRVNSMKNRCSFLSRNRNINNRVIFGTRCLALLLKF